MAQNIERGYIQIYTGNGKGKTTAAIGLAIRALGAGKRVLFLQFMKQATYSEHKVLKDLSPRLKIVTLGKPYFIARRDQISPEAAAAMGNQIVVFEPGKPPADYVALINKGLSLAREALMGQSYDLVVLDELCVVLHLGLADVQEVLAMLKERQGPAEVVITGRGAPPELLNYADLVTEMREVKHYYHQGVPARTGIEN
ncbi:MAG: cob(I)yrinic acid a,c-diamide adenosyltransferase [Firmicutes bacterium]|jgi:cob(I)alamin adenosyltransferase|nr:cob(I)yrinic acid a,c-diamide adenosyltransferase [Bacillota bacterium]